VNKFSIGGLKVKAAYSDVEPTYDNTGYRVGSLTDMTPAAALAADGTTISGKRITGSLDFKVNGGYSPLGKTYTFVDCEIQGEVGVNTGLNSGSGQGNITADVDMITINMSHCRVTSGLSTTAGFKGTISYSSFGNKCRWGVNDTYNPGSAAAGGTFHRIEHCYLYAPYQAAPSHYEVVQSFTKIDGLDIYNCTFEQGSGSLSGSGVTAICNLAVAPDNVFDRCFFLWEDGEVPAYYALYAAGSGTFQNCFIEPGASFLYPGSGCTFTNCRNYDTNALLTLP